MNVNNVGKSLLDPVSFIHMNELIRERSPMDVNIGEAFSRSAHLPRHERPHSAEKPFSVNNVGKPSLDPLTFTYMNDFIMGRRLINVNNVG